jgi:hypothetical protein
MYNQYKVTASYSTQDGTSPSSSVILSGTQLGSSSYTLTLTKTAQTTWLDATTSWSVNNPITSGSERWDASSGTSGTVSGAVTVAPEYYDQYQVTAEYSTSDGSTPSPSVTLSGTQFGSSSYQLTLTTSVQNTWLDVGKAWSVNNPITSGTQRWDAASGTSGTVSGATSIAPLYYHQYQQTLSYVVVDGGSPSAPTATGTSLGASYVPTLTTTATAYWFDASGSVTFSTSTSGSNEQWAPNPASVLATSAHTQVVSMYNQYKQTLSYVVVDGGSPSAPTATGTSLGSAYAPSLTTTATGYWFDASGSIAISTPTSGSTERWSPSPSSISATSANTQVISMYNQYQLTVTASPSGAIGGTFKITYTQLGTTYSNQQETTTWTSWADASSTATVTSYASPVNGYSFVSYTPSSGSVTMTAAETITLNY